MLTILFFILKTSVSCLLQRKDRIIKNISKHFQRNKVQHIKNAAMLASVGLFLLGGPVLGREGGPSPGHRGNHAHGEGLAPSLFRFLISQTVSWAAAKAKLGCTSETAL